ncbi:MAG: elongation factor, partial [Pseudomonadota bacterium]|nr:elongation factor [Pseudomonadota bacterium]
ILGKLAMEDPTIQIERHPTTNETVVRGHGDMHLKAKLAKMVQQ